MAAIPKMIAATTNKVVPLPRYCHIETAAMMAEIKPAPAYSISFTKITSVLIKRPKSYEVPLVTTDEFSGNQLRKIPHFVLFSNYLLDC